MDIRRVATGHTADGKATVSSDLKIKGTTVAFLPGFELHTLWGADQPPTFPDDGSMPSFERYFPAEGGVRFGVVTFPPETNSDEVSVEPEAAMAEVEEKWPGMAATWEADNPGMHTSDTVDFEFIISGEIWLELDNGEEIHLKAGDTVVQNGTRHAWHNRSKDPCRMVVCLVGAKRG